MAQNKDYKRCSVTVMDTTDPDITFDENGVCNYVHSFKEKQSVRVVHGKEGEQKLEAIVQKIKQAGKNKEYDCIIGVSGGVDSTYVAYLCKNLGLRPLAVHFDNGWNSELAVSNIEKVLNKLDIDLYTYVINWDEFKDLQIAFLKASTPDLEIPTDHAIVALLMEIAAKYNIKYIINGMNYYTEGIMPDGWAYGHSDWKYIKSIHKIFGKKQLKKYPHFSFTKLFYFLFVRKIKFLSILNYINYDKAKAMEFLETDLNWRYYGGKHYESIYTKLVQGYILPKKFNIDKRKAHLSNLILADQQISRGDALKELEKTPYDTSQIDNEIEYLLKKFEITREEFNDIMKKPVKSFRDYPNNFKFFQFLKKVQFTLRKKGLQHK